MYVYVQDRDLEPALPTDTSTTQFLPSGLRDHYRRVGIVRLRGTGKNCEIPRNVESIYSWSLIHVAP